MNKSLNFVLHKKNISLKKYNNFKIEAKALNFYIPETINGFVDLLKYFNDIKKKYIILGGGSNILFVDDFIISVPIFLFNFYVVLFYQYIAVFIKKLPSVNLICSVFLLSKASCNRITVFSPAFSFKRVNISLR